MNQNAVKVILRDINEMLCRLDKIQLCIEFEQCANEYSDLFKAICTIEATLKKFQAKIINSQIFNKIPPIFLGAKPVDKKIRKIEKESKKVNKDLKSLEKADKKRDKVVALAKLVVKKKGKAKKK